MTYIRTKEHRELMNKYFLSKKSRDSIKSYYKIAKLFLPKNPQWRIWKFRIDDGSEKGKIIKIPDQIRDIETLRKWLCRLVVRDAYYSSGCFRNPSSVKGSKSENLLLFRDLVFDFDADEPYGAGELEIVRSSTVRLINYIKFRMGLYPKYIIYTGFKGFQVVYEFRELTNEMIRDLHNLNGIDIDVTTDKYRVIRLPLTINKSGRLAVFITEKDLNKGIHYILNKSKQIYSPQNSEDRAGMPNKANDNFPHSKVNGEGSEVCSNRPSSLFKEITNEVVGTERFIPILKYDIKSFINPKKEMKKLAEKYGLNEWFLIYTQDNIVCISLVAFDKARLKKVLNSTNSISKIEFTKFNKIFLKTSEEHEYLTIINFDYPKKDFLYSRPHMDYLKYLNFAVDPYKKYIGYEKPMILLVKTK